MRAISWPEDGRYYQIAALGVLLGLNIAFLDLGAKPLPSLLAVAGALATQALCSRLWRLPAIDLRSPLITGLSLSLLLRADEPWLHAAAGVIAIASKFGLRIDGKHVWNPAGFAIVALLFATDRVWISPGQWGASLWFAALLGFLAHPRAAACAARRHRALLSREPRGAAFCPRSLARRSAGDSAASAAERLAANLRLLHDLRSAAPRPIRGLPAVSSRLPWRCWRIISPFSCSCARRSMWR